MTDRLTDERVRELLEEATPGPWEYDHPGALERQIIKGPDTDAGWRGSPFRGVGGPVLLRRTNQGSMPTEANARLMAAAPDLARALLEARAEVALIPDAVEAGARLGEQRERARIVAWLREHPWGEAEDLADAIERGEDKP